MKLTGKKLLFILLYAPTRGKKTNVPISGRTRLMKMAFLFEKEVLGDFVKDRAFDEISLPSFYSWNYGPFSSDFLNDLEFLINQGYIKTEFTGGTPISAELDEYKYWIEDFEDFQAREYEEELFSLEEKGLTRAAAIWDSLTSNQRQLVIKFKDSLNAAPLDRILDYVYKKYAKDGYIDKSLIREKYLS